MKKISRSPPLPVELCIRMSFRCVCLLSKIPSRLNRRIHTRHIKLECVPIFQSFVKTVREACEHLIWFPLRKRANFQHCNPSKRVRGQSNCPPRPWFPDPRGKINSFRNFLLCSFKPFIYASSRLKNCNRVQEQKSPLKPVKERRGIN